MILTSKGCVGCNNSFPTSHIIPTLWHRPVMDKRKYKHAATEQTLCIIAEKMRSSTSIDLPIIIA